MTTTTNKKIRVAVLMGGNSSEREISLQSGKTVVQYLRSTKFSVKSYDTKRDLKKFLNDCLAHKIDACFIALHGKGGEDGSIQGLLEVLKIPYTGSGILASAIGMNKVVQKEILKENKILVPKYISFKSSDYEQAKSRQAILREIKQKICFPCCLKPANSGSSRGVSIVKKEKDLAKSIKLAFNEDEEIIVEEYISGKEITVGILDTESPQALPIVEIVPKRKFFDFKAKYDPKFCQEIIPAKLPKKITQEAKKIAKRVHKIINCKGFSRVDMIVKGTKIYTLEINTIPGLTPQALCPKLSEVVGFQFPNFLIKL